MGSNQTNALDNLRGAVAVLREVVLALMPSHPACAELLPLVLTTAQQLHDLAHGSTQPDATLEGMAAELAYWRRVGQRWRHTPGPGSAP